MTTDTELTLNGFMAEGYVLVDNKRGGVEWLDVAGNPLKDDGSEMMEELVFERLRAVHEIFRLMEDPPRAQERPGVVDVEVGAMSDANDGHAEAALCHALMSCNAGMPCEDVNKVLERLRADGWDLTRGKRIDEHV